ncbi:DUF4304 domain-containing protein [Dyadobacter sp. NIV53]|uniref:DUF4304 domain-containing protein n=1 Tax=Dyadobacter sp. NIV53 TaxID=2861765 RepID=UPI001C88A9AD|nr:DUF4304 domain-containing protein [Dyadobacter sp. NIV53]
MKTETQMKFERIVKSGFQEILKPLGFKKKGNNFYLQIQDFGHIVNLQKSSFSSKDHISFTTNVGIFIPEYWNIMYNYHDDDTPSFPTELVCAIRKRIGSLTGEGDVWFELNEETMEELIVDKMRQNLRDYILPYFKSFSTRENLIHNLDKEDIVSSPLARIIIYGEYNLNEKAKEEYVKLLASRITPAFRQTVKEYGAKYGIINALN